MTGINENVGTIAATMGHEDQFAQRRSNAPEAYGNPYNPESLISVGEDPLGPYDHRLFPTLDDYKKAVAGKMTPDEILRVAPRVKGLAETSYGDESYTEPVRLGLQAESQGFTVVYPGIYATNSLDALAAIL